MIIINSIKGKLLTLLTVITCFTKEEHSGLHWRLVVKNPPATAGDEGSIPGPGKSHTLRDTKPGSATAEPGA